MDFQNSKSGESITIKFQYRKRFCACARADSIFRKIGYISETRRDIKMLSKGLFISIKNEKYFIPGSISYSDDF